MEDKGSRTTHTWHYPITVTPMMTILGQREALDVREMVAMTPKDASSMHLSENKGIRVRYDSVNQLVKESQLPNAGHIARRYCDYMMEGGMFRSCAATRCTTPHPSFFQLQG